jgi:intracellular septation protein A
MKTIVSIGAVLLIIMGVWHAVHVGRADDVEPYLWVASLFLLVQGGLTLIFVRSTSNQS